jgi:hypothetical protein
MAYQVNLVVDGLGDSDYGVELLDFSFQCRREIAHNQKVSGTVMAGTIYCTFDAALEKCPIFEWMVTNTVIKNGTIQIYDEDHEGSPREIVFKDAKIGEYGESFTKAGNANNLINLTIAAEKITIWDKDFDNTKPSPIRSS